MFAGLPGTGIGSVFYLLLTIWMPINEMYLVSRGRSSLERWRFIAMRWAVFAVVLGVIYLQARLMKGLLPQGTASSVELAQALGLDAERVAQSGLGTMALATLAACGSLMLVMALVYTLRIAVKVHDRVRA